MSKIEKQVTERLLEQIADLGFIQVDDFLLTRKSGEVDWQLKCGVRTDSSTGKHWVSLLAGLRFESVNRFWEPTLNERNASTLSVPIHLLHADRTYIEWDAESKNTAPQLANEVRKYAIPFLTQFENKAALIESLGSEDPQNWLGLSRNSRPELLAALLASMGRREEALDLVDTEIRARSGKPVGHCLGLIRIKERITGVRER